jgi:hypothetical protein
MNITTEFYLNGFVQFELKDTPLKSRFLDAIRRARDSEFDSTKFTWRAKYRKSADFRESIFDFDPVFIDILKENNIPEEVTKATNYRKNHLCHIQLRKAFPGGSYMDWHRDSSYTNGRPVGPLPPGYKLIYYPLFKEEEPCLKVIPGSHRRCFEDSGRDKKINLEFGEKVITSSDDVITLFDISMWHAAINGTDPNGNLRLIYSYASPEFYLSNWKENEINQRINDYYEAKPSLTYA